MKEKQAGIPQCSVLGFILHILYTDDKLNQEQDKFATFTDDTAILSIGQDEITSTRLLQKARGNIHNGTRKWKIKLNEEKAIHITLTNKRLSHHH